MTKKEYVDVVLRAVAKVMLSAIERKHPYTKGHSERVSTYAVLLAQHLETPWTGEDLEHLRIGGWLHDIGKLCVDESTLDNPGRRLSTEQIRELEDHPVDGWEIMRKSEIEVPDIVRDAIFSHHESFDGRHDGDLRGYPMGIHGEHIPLTGRIIAVADTFDALTSKRAYQSVVSFEEAARKLRELAGNRLDPVLVEVFVEKVIPLLST